MSARICPKCGNKLTKTSNYFCNYCGDILANSLVSKPIVANVNIAHFDLLTDKKSFKLFYSIITSKYFALLLFIVALFSLYLLFFSKKITETTKPVIQQYTDKIGCDGEFICGEFGSDAISTIVPENVALYVEGFDFKKFSQFVLDYDSSYSSLIYELTYLDSKHLALFVENIDGNYYWTFLIESSKDPTGNLINLINNPKNIYIGRMSNFYVVSSRRNILGDLQKSKEGLTKNIGHNNVYTIATNKTKEGQLLILPIGDNGKSIIEKILNNEKAPSYIRTILSKINFEKDTYLIN